MDDPLAFVRASAAAVAAAAQHVAIDDAALARLAATLAARPAPVWTEPVHALGAQHGDADRVQYLLVLDALNFCFWPAEGTADAFEYDDLAGSLARAFVRCADDFSAGALVALTEDKLAEMAGRRLPVADERVRLLREVGAALLREFDGSAATMVRRANGSARELVRLVTAHMPGFRDTCVYAGRQVALYKRAQIFVADVWGALHGRAPLGHFDDLDALTTFADYRVPQLLAAVGVMRYDAELARRIAAREELCAGERAEVELRAATIVAVERLRHVLATEHGKHYHSVQVDWMLWQDGEAQRDTLPPHHRCRTIFY